MQHPLHPQRGHGACVLIQPGLRMANGASSFNAEQPTTCMRTAPQGGRGRPRQRAGSLPATAGGTAIRQRDAMRWPTDAVQFAIALLATASSETALRDGSTRTHASASAAHPPKTKTGPEGPVFMIWSGKRDSNSRPQPWQGCALPTELFPLEAANSTGTTQPVNRCLRFFSRSFPPPPRARRRAGSARPHAGTGCPTTGSGSRRSPGSSRRRGR